MIDEIVPGQGSLPHQRCICEDVVWKNGMVIPVANVANVAVVADVLV